MTTFKNRSDAGKQLAVRLHTYQNKPDMLILALPRGGVPVAYEIANTLHAPMTTFLVRKLGVPGHEELAMGAIAEESHLFLNEELILQLGITQSQIDGVLQSEKNELQRRLQLYRHGKKLPPLNNKIVILVDDGIATGATLRVVIQALKSMSSKKIVIATPIASADSIALLAPMVDTIVCLETPEPFYAVGQGYTQFEQVDDDEVVRLLSAQQYPS